MIDRRTFMKQAGGLASAAMAMSAGTGFSRPPLQQRPRYKMGLQLFTMRAALARDVEGSFKRFAALGYEEVETYGFDPAALSYYKLPAKAFAQVLRDNN